MLPGGTYVQVLETVPAKRVFAILAHHLGTALVAFDVNPTNGALLDGGFCVCPKEGPRNKMDEKLLGGGGVKNAARTTRVSADQGWVRVGRVSLIQHVTKAVLDSTLWAPIEFLRLLMGEVVASPSSELNSLPWKRVGVKIGGTQIISHSDNSKQKRTLIYVSLARSHAIIVLSTPDLVPYLAMLVFHSLSTHCLKQKHKHSATQQKNQFWIWHGIDKSSWQSVLIKKWNRSRDARINTWKSMPSLIKETCSRQMPRSAQAHSLKRHGK